MNAIRAHANKRTVDQTAYAVALDLHLHPETQQETFPLQFHLLMMSTESNPPTKNRPQIGNAVFLICS